MKKIVSVLLVMVLAVSLLSVGASAKEPEDILISRTVETLENGDMIITELYENAIQPRTGKNGYKIYSYASAGRTIWDLTVNGAFEYTYGVSSRATTAIATVRIYDSRAELVSKEAYTSGSTAVARATVSYNGISVTRSVSITCDKYGNLS